MIHQYMLDAYSATTGNASFRATVLTPGYEDLFGWGTSPGAAMEDLEPKLEARESALSMAHVQESLRQAPKLEALGPTFDQELRPLPGIRYLLPVMDLGLDEDDLPEAWRSRSS